MCKDDDGVQVNLYLYRKPDSLKPVLDRVLEHIVAAFSEKDREFYEREFSFFNQVTGISGSLKPLVQAGATKADKKVCKSLILEKN